MQVLGKNKQSWCRLICQAAGGTVSMRMATKQITLCSALRVLPLADALAYFASPWQEKRRVRDKLEQEPFPPHIVEQLLSKTGRRSKEPPILKTDTGGGKSVGEKDPPSLVFRLQLPANFAEGKGLRVEVARLSDACRAARSEWARLVQGGASPSQIGMAQGTYSEFLREWRMIAKDSPKALAALDDSISRETHERALQSILSAIVRRLKDFPRIVAPVVKGLSEEAAEKILDKEVEALTRSLYQGDAVEEESWETEAEEQEDRDNAEG